jgi:HAE1 family hydrophobic/amphiphilic exporter-1
MGKFFKEFGLTVVFAMTISIIDALTIAPMLSAYIIPDHGEKAVPGESKNARFWKTVVKIFRKFTVDWFNVAFSFIEELYKNLISFIIREKFADIPMAFFGRNKKRFAVSWKFMTLFVAALVFLMTIFAAKKYIKATFMPASEWGEFNIVVTAKPGTSLEQMDKYSKQIEEIIMGDSDIELVSSSIGSCDMFTNLSNRASIYVKMIPNESSDRLIEKVVGLFDRKGNKPVSKIRTRTTSQMKDYIREVLNKKFSGELEFSIVGQSIGAGVESEFIMELSGDNVDILHDFADRLIERYKTIPCFVDVHSNYKIGKPEVQIRMDQKKMENLGVSSALVGSEIRAIVEGVSAGKYRENGVEYDIKVKFKDSQRDILENFGDIYISNINHKLVKLKNVAFTRKIYGPDRIYRKDRFRYVTVEGNVAVGGAMSEIQKEALRIFKEEKCNPKNSQKWKNIDYKLSGNAEDMDDMFKSITAACALSIIFIFIVLASLYESVVTPFTIMTALPLAIIGGIIALLLFKQPVDIFTMIGMIMLLGIVAKNSILLVDYIQQQMRSGLNIDESIVKAGAVRLRPILMTSFALIAGMFPTALGFGELGKFRRSMGIVIIGGIISSTVLTLIVVPAIFEYMDKFRRFLRQLAGRPEKRMIDCSEEQLKEKDL